jgi:hypothetical protein
VPEIVTASYPAVFQKKLSENFGFEYVHAHTDQRHSGPGWKRARHYWLFLKSDDLQVIVHLDNSEPTRLFHRVLDRRNGEVGVGFSVALNQLTIIHIVNVVAAKNQNELRFCGLERSDILEDGIRRAPVPFAARWRKTYQRRLPKSRRTLADPGPGLADVRLQLVMAVFGKQCNAERAVEAVR